MGERAGTRTHVELLTQIIQTAPDATLSSLNLPNDDSSELSPEVAALAFMLFLNDTDEAEELSEFSLEESPDVLVPPLHLVDFKMQEALVDFVDFLEKTTSTFS